MTLIKQINVHQYALKRSLESIIIVTLKFLNKKVRK